MIWIPACDQGLGREEPSFQRPGSVEHTAEPVNEDNICSNSADCSRACSQMFFAAEEKERCKNLSVNDAELVYKVFVYMEEPVSRNLRRIRENEWHLFLHTGLFALNDLIRNYTISESKRVLSWIAEERSISRALFTFGSTFYREVLLNLFLVMEPAEAALHRSLKYGDTFFDISHDRSNDHAVYMAHQVITDDLCGKRQGINLYPWSRTNHPEACILRVYCHYRGNQYIHYDNFRFISEVIEYDDIFDYIQEEDEVFGLNLNYTTINNYVCDEVCGDVPGGCLD